MSKFILKSMPSKAYLQKEQVPEVEQYVHNSTESHDQRITNLDLVVEEQVLNELEQVLNVGRDVVSRPLEYKVEKVKGEKEKEELCVYVCVCMCVGRVGAPYSNTGIPVSFSRAQLEYACYTVHPPQHHWIGVCLVVGSKQ